MWQFAWMFNLIPDGLFVWITYILMALGLGLYVASKLVSWFPLINKYRLPAEIVGVVVLMFASYLYSGVGYREMIAELNEKVKLSEQKAAEANTKVETKVVEKIKIVEKKVEAVRTQIVKDKEIINADCRLNATAIKDYNAAIADPDEEKK
jgi:hypothetical protein